MSEDSLFDAIPSEVSQHLVKFSEAIQNSWDIIADYRESVKGDKSEVRSLSISPSKTVPAFSDATCPDRLINGLRHKRAVLWLVHQIALFKFSSPKVQWCGGKGPSNPKRTGKFVVVPSCKRMLEINFQPFPGLTSEMRLSAPVFHLKMLAPVERISNPYDVQLGRAERITACLRRCQNLCEKQSSKRMHLDKQATTRFVRTALWQSAQSKTKKRRMDSESAGQT
ncbi:unnamed protein product [Dibothriocephalus latus]|uniref:Uncharacterized protein n=1 Tax=Dibothriocephalus latus TaxID=60516 RepID=A0A3P7NT49_DIBLA|nr:unnamed protein product [Dibothriocephalus latus]